MIFNLALISSIVSTPILAGALKDRSPSGTVRTLTKIISPVVGIFPLCYLFYTLLQAAGIQTSFDSGQPQNYGAIPLILFAGCSYLISLKLVEFGEKIGKEERCGIRDDTRNVTEQVEQILVPKLQEHASQVETRTGIILDKKLGEYMSHLDGTLVKIVTGFEELKDACYENVNFSENIRSTNDKVQQTLGEVKTELESLRGFTGEVVDLCNKLDEKNIILQSRIEALEPEKQDRDMDTQDEAGAKLTSQDGMANRTIGLEAQHEMARYLGEIGFDIKESRGAGEADYIIRKKDEIVAIGSNKAYMLYNEPKRMQRRISSKDVEPEIILAKKLQVPLVILVTNRRNGRRWVAIVSENDLSQWSGVSTPVILAKDDEPSEKILQEDFASVLGTMGAVI
jgi:predicted nuclease with TOPRIM domain